MGEGHEGAVEKDPEDTKGPQGDGDPGDETDAKADGVGDTTQD